MRIGIIVVLLLGTSSLFSQTVFINEVDYKAPDKWVEIAGPAGTNVSGWQLDVYDNVNPTPTTYTFPTPSTIDNENSSGRGGIWIPVAGVQDDNTIILKDDNNNPQDTVSYGNNAALGSILPPQVLSAITPQNLTFNGNDDVSLWSLATATQGDLNNVSQLPVELISFEANIQDDVVLIRWSTASEENNSHFEIERSVDGITYEMIGITNGNGTTFEEQHYEYEDYNIQNGRNYYRLKQVDNDGQFEYSEVITIDFSKEISVTIAPNPVTQNSKLNIQLSQFENVDFVLFDITGKVVKTYYGIDKNGILINNLNSGIYIYQVRQQQLVIKTDKLIVID